MSIDQIIKEQMNHPTQPRWVITIANDTGSFTIPKNVRLILLNCNDITCSSNEGANELTCVNCSGVTISSFNEGQIRLDNCSNIQQITTSAETLLIISGSPIQKLTLTNTEAVLLENTFQGETIFTKCKITSTKNTYQQLTVNSCKDLISDQDTFQGALEISTDSVGTLFQPTIQGALTIDASVVNLYKATSQGELTFTDCKVIDDQGSYMQKLTASGDSLALELNQSNFQNEVTLSDGVVNIDDGSFQNKVTVENLIFNTKNSKFQSEFTCTGSSAIIVDCSFQQQVTVETSAVNSTTNTFQQEVSITGGSWESELSTFQNEFMMTGGTVLSRKDAYQDNITSAEIIYENLLWKPDQGKNLTVSASDSSSKFELVSWQGQDATISDLAVFETLDSQFQNVTLSSLSFAHLINAEVEKFTATDCSTILWDDGDIGNDSNITTTGTVILNNVTGTKLSVNRTGHFLAATAEIDQLTIDEIDLGTTSDCDQLSITDSNVIDSGSTIQTCTRSILLASISTISGAENSSIVAVEGSATVQSSYLSITNGTFIATNNSVVSACTSTGTNTNGQTSGTGFSADTQSSALLFDGTNTIIQASIGNLNLNSSVGDVNINANAGNINNTAALNYAITALNVNTTIGTNINLTCGGEVIVTEG